MLNDYLGLSEFVDGIEIFPVSILQWKEFEPIASEFLLYGYDFVNYRIKPEKEVKHFDLILSLLSREILETQNTKCEIVKRLEKMFNIVTKQKCEFVVNSDGAYVKFDTNLKDNKIEKRIDRDNFDEIRNVIMRQNLIFEPLVVEDEYTQEVIDDMVVARNRTNRGFDFLSMLVYVCCARGLKPKDLQDYTYYQLRCDCEMVQRIEFNESIHAYRSQGAKIDNLDVYKKLSSLSNPNSWDSFFKKIDAQEEEDMKRVMGG